MDRFQSVWQNLTSGRRLIAVAASIAVFVLILALARSGQSRDMTLLYSQLDAGTAGEVLAALDQANTPYEVRGNAIYVDASMRDSLRMTLAGQGLPRNGTQGYELLDGLSGFGTTSQMFDAAYWRAKEGELARTIQASPHISAARVHISNPSSRPFARAPAASASVTISTGGAQILPRQVNAVRFLVATAVTGLSPQDVAVIDDVLGLIAHDQNLTGDADETRAEMLRARAQRLLEARVGVGNAIVELSLETDPDSEKIVERRIDPDSRIAVSTDVEERTNASTDSMGSDVTVASNVPTGDGAASGTATDENAENRTITNYDFSETQRELVRAPGAIKRMSVAVLVNQLVERDEDGTDTYSPRSAEELEALKELVASAVGLDTERGDSLTLKSFKFDIPEIAGTAAAEPIRPPLNLVELAKIASLALTAIFLGFFVIRPILMAPKGPVLLAGSNAEAMLNVSGSDIEPIEQDGPLRIETQTPDRAVNPDFETPDKVERLKSLIEQRQVEAVQVLRGWIEEPDSARAKS